MSPMAPELDTASASNLLSLVDHRSEQRGIEVVVLGVPRHDVLVLERVPDARVPARLRRLRVGEDGHGDREDGGSGDEDLHTDSVAITPVDERVQILERPVVHVGEVGPTQLLLVRNQALLAQRRIVDDRAGRPHLGGGGDRDHRVEAGFAAGLVQQRHLGRTDGGRLRKRGELLAPAHVRGPRPEDGEALRATRAGSGRRRRRDRRACGRSHPSASRMPSPRRWTIACFTSGSWRSRWVDDLVARDHRRAVTLEGSSAPRISLRRCRR